MSIIGAIFVITLPIALIVFIISAIIRSVRRDNNAEESFQDIIRTMYIYLVMIIFLMLFVGSTISLFNSCLELLLPESSQYEHISTVTSTNRTIADVTTNIAILCISIPMFLYYSTLAKKDHNEIQASIKKMESK
ncbi:MAG: hypothetical protein K0R72_473 [Clostridia bacterium]|nr:hypothetical protein [Clostridia bacterium]